MHKVRYNQQLKRLDLTIMIRILSVLSEIGRSKKTTIARNSKMSYDNCLKYLKLLGIFGFISIEINENGFEIIGLTEQGMNLLQKISMLLPTVS